MGTFKAAVEIGDPQGARFRALEATVDTGATYTRIPAALLRELAVPVLERRPFELPDGRVADYDVGETKIRIDGRVVTTLVTFGDPGAGPVLGAYTLEGSPSTRSGDGWCQPEDSCSISPRNRLQTHSIRGRPGSLQHGNRRKQGDRSALLR